jgi:acyl carrier protein
LGGQQDVIAQWTATRDDSEDDGEEWTEDAVARMVTAREIEQWLIQRIAARLRIASHKIGVATPFLEFGIGSMDAVQIVADLERWLGRRLSPTAVYNYPNIAALARYLANDPPRPDKAGPHVDVDSAAPEGTPEEILREVKELSQDEIETYILQEMAKQEGT